VALTKEDLQAIGQMMDSKLEPLKTDMLEVKADMQGVKADIQDVKERVTRVELTQGEIKERVTKMEVTQEEVRERVTRIELTQENVILPRIQLLAEGHSGIVDSLDRLDDLPDQVEDIQTTVSVLKHVFKEHTHS